MTKQNDQNLYIKLLKMTKLVTKKMRDAKLGIKKDATRDTNDAGKHDVDIIAK